MKTAVLGATGHVGLNLAKQLCSSSDHEVMLYCRSVEKAERLFQTEIRQQRISLLETDLSRVLANTPDLIINCVGYGDPAAVMKAGVEVFRLTEVFDNQVLAYLETHPDARYINFSSGAVYGTGFERAVLEEDATRIRVNDIQPVDFYRIAKLNAEAKHRACSRFHIVDLRLFNFFSRFIDLSTRFLISEIVTSLLDKIVFQTTDSDIVRDFISPSDLCDLVIRISSAEPMNAVFDARSLKPVSKMELLRVFSEKFGLEYNIDRKLEFAEATGKKNVYVSENRSAERILGFQPKHTSMDTLVQETEAILGKIG